MLLYDVSGTRVSIEIPDDQLPTLQQTIAVIVIYLSYYFVLLIRDVWLRYTVCVMKVVLTKRDTTEASAMLPAWRPSPCTFHLNHSYNPSIACCWKGCDYATGRVNDPELRKEAEDMCKTYTAEAMYTKRGELEELRDLRVHAEMFPTHPTNIYRACLAGIRRQKF